ncbi:AsnC family protein [Actinomadura hibisca]|uniref:AsnC family protein n=1 Tax=Actinomadura hibisca TaxID=68565 RepID=UPI0012FAC3CF|nr:hypothetical protein [Actinomadura hibisca]
MPIRVMFSTPYLHDGAWVEEAAWNADRILVDDGRFLVLDKGEILAEVPVDSVSEIELKRPRASREVRAARKAKRAEAAEAAAAAASATSAAEEAKEPKAHAWDAIRAEHAQAYRPWDAEQERRLLAMHDAGASNEEIGAALGRQPSAISSRLRRLRGY